MPIYGYICEKCGAHTEVMQKISDPPLKRCKKCRGKLGKTVSRTSFKLKGSGWYMTDYSSKPASSTSKTDGSGDVKPLSPSTKGKTASSSEGKPESAPSPANKDSAGLGSAD
ncbi:MAG TPA: FmdB family zinc ribbon protein [Blastocatellia bacterium]|nr:FmdB family zinc ribbon protein [Blastocatellia bacterium]